MATTAAEDTKLATKNPQLEKDEPDTDEDVEDVPAVAPREPWLLEQLAQGAVLLLLTASVNPISYMTLAPVFGTVPSVDNHSWAVVYTFLLGFWLHFVTTFLSERTQGWMAANFREYLTVWPFWIPVVQSVMLPYSAYLGPVAGPIIQSFFACHAVVLPSAFALADLYRSMKFGGRDSLLKTGLVISAILVVPFVNLELGSYHWMKKLMMKYKSITPVHLQLALASAYFLVFLSWTPIFSLTIPGFLHTIFFNQHLSKAMVNEHLAPYNWTLIDRQYSNENYISVLESSVDEYRVLRADHSLLGGEFYLTVDRKFEQGWKVNEPIYAVFEMLEAIRLIETSPKISDSKAKALVVGLGIGTAPKAMISHGIDTTILELDPVVYDFAKKYFDLPADHTAVIEDAVEWVNRTATLSLHQKYDYIIHDVFTGGVEPLPLFTSSFLIQLRQLLTPKGLIALNYAGDLSNPLTTTILHTIAHVFGGPSHCKIYRDSPKPTPHQSTSTSTANTETADFLNMVIFCRNNPGPITFRKPVEKDFLESKSRAFYMVPKAELEIPFPEKPSSFIGRPSTSAAKVNGSKDILELDDVEGWAKSQRESAVRHWRIMRGVVPDAVWELW